MSKESTMKIFIFITIISFHSSVIIVSGFSCSFPTQAVRHIRHQHWKWKLQYDEYNRQKEKYIVNFQENTMTVKSVVTPGGTLHKKAFIRTCIEKVKHNTFLVMHEETGQMTKYLCMEFVFRSTSILQMRSSTLQSSYDLSMCRDSEMSLDRWPLVRQSTLHEDYKVCSFSGGFDLHIDDLTGRNHGCNQLKMPMRMESECLSGEGVMFDFRYAHCIENLPLTQQTKAYCVTDWVYGNNRYLVLRKFIGYKNNLWCLQIPLNQGYTFGVTLYLDFKCGESDIGTNTKFIKFILTRSTPPDICSDENPSCHRLKCNRYTEQQCLKTCKLCRTSSTGSCSFPQDMQGKWFQRTLEELTKMTVTSAQISIETVGKFSCLAPPATLDKTLRKFALLSNFNNGCRARYTCIAIRNYNSPSVLAYSLGQSVTWPYKGDKSAEIVCENEHFKKDPPPFAGKFRSYVDTPKTTISEAYSLTGVKCGILDAFRVDAEFSADGKTCSGRIYRDCKDMSRLRFEYVDCKSQPITSDYVCLANYTGRYWQKIIAIQNLRDQNDARCFVFSELRPNEVLMLAASECDKNSWEYFTSGKLKAIALLKLTKLSYKCKNIPFTTTTTTLKPPSQKTDSMVLSKVKLADGPKYDSTLRPLQPKLSFRHNSESGYAQSNIVDSQIDHNKNKAYEQKNVESHTVRNFCATIDRISIFSLVGVAFVIASSCQLDR